MGKTAELDCPNFRMENRKCVCYSGDRVMTLFPQEKEKLWVPSNMIKIRRDRGRTENLSYGQEEK